MVLPHLSLPGSRVPSSDLWWLQSHVRLPCCCPVSGKSAYIGLELGQSVGWGGRAVFL